jgi:hypothetical protein
MAKNEKTARVRITCQFRDKVGMVYDLKCDTISLTISLALSSNCDTEWNIEATDRRMPDPRAIRAVGSSRSEALLAVAQAWREKGEAAGFALLDWNAIRDVLASVRAI